MRRLFYKARGGQITVQTARIRLLPQEEGGLTPAAALTAYAGTEDRMHALGAGFQIHAPKPVRPAELAAVVFSLARGPAR